MAGRIIRLAVCFAWALSQGDLARAEDAPVKDAPLQDSPAEATQAAATGALSTQQQQVLERYSELEKKLLRMAELTAGTDPHRAALLRKAVAQSKQQGIEAQLTQLVELLGQERLGLAIKNQASVEQDLTKLLQLLLSEDRSKRLQSEKERIQKYIQRVNQLIKQQKQLQGEAAGEGDMQQIAQSQAKLAEKTGELARDLGAEQESEKKDKKPVEAKSSDAQGSDDEKSEGKSGDNPPGDNKSADKSKPTKRKPADGGGEKKPGEPGEGKSDQGQPGDKTPSEQPPAGDPPGEKKSDDDKPGEEKSADDKSDGKPGQPGESKSAEGQDSSGKSDSPGKNPPGQQKPNQGSPGQPGEPSDGAAPQGDTKPKDESADENDSGSTRRRVAQAEQKMREAERKLADAQRQQAVEKQEEAKRELELAKAELEAILRQLREEEIGRTLAMLESRFRKMLDMQNQVNTGTKRLDNIPADQRDHDDEIEAGRLSRQEALIVEEANKALAVLHDEGSAVAFPEAVSDLRDDMEQVVVRLAQAKVDAMTQGVEDDIVVSLEEMIAAFHKAQKQVEAKGGQAGGDQESPLVDTLAEIKMIRSMQMWVNGRTKRFTEMSKTDQADTPELIASLRKLAEREDRIHRAARDIVVGRNK